MNTQRTIQPHPQPLKACESEITDINVFCRQANWENENLN
jgi:hypothetical protein